MRARSDLVAISLEGTDQLLFPEQIAYSHFSDDGKRLFVLTQNQLAFVMDVSGVGHLPSAPSSN